MKFKDLGTFVDFLDESGELLKIEEELDPVHEISAAIRYGAEKTGKAILVRNVRGHDCPVVGNLLGTRERLGKALGVADDTLDDKFLFKEEDLISPEIVDSAEVKDIIIKNNIDLFDNLPVLTYHEGDVSPYITQGLVFMKDVETGFQTMGVHRLQVKSKDRLGIFFASSTSTEILRKAENRKEALEVAVVIGVDPATLLASVIWAPFGNKFEISGALRGEALEMVQAETVDLKIPAHAMFVLEGKIPPGVREVEGPFGESTGYYITANNPVIELEAICKRERPIYPVFIPWDKEDSQITDITFAPSIFKYLKDFPSVVAVRLFGVAGVVIISIKKRYDSEPREMLYSLLSLSRYIKIAMVVDDDVDLESQKELAWAWGTRFSPDKDLIVVDSVSGSLIDPTAKGKDAVTSKLGIDATKPVHEKNAFRKIESPGKVWQKINLLFQRYLNDA